MAALTVMTLGGTIDKVYFDAASEYQVGEPQVGRLLRLAGITDFEIKALMRKDSLEMTDADRAAVCEAVHTCETLKILITHGTDTMVQTARAIGRCDKTVVFVGAIQPALMMESDAAFNIGFALGVLARAAPGVYVAMNGTAFDPYKVRKNRAEGRFELIDERL